jgi:hypothetical protein
VSYPLSVITAFSTLKGSPYFSRGSEESDFKIPSIRG